MPAYLDHNATTPLDARVLEAMLPYLQDAYGNPSSVHYFGRMARNALDAARGKVADLVGVHPGQVVFTSGGTEANNLVLKGLSAKLPRGKILISAVEHSAMLEPAEQLAANGWQVEKIPVDAQCRIDTGSLEKMLDDDVRLVSVMTANNETGVIQQISEIAARVRAAGAIFHTDAAQAAGKIPVDFSAGGAHMMSLSAHKLYGPKGIGALIVDKSVDVTPQIQGGGQEEGRRAGTEDVAAIVGLGRTAELAMQEMSARAEHTRALRDELEKELQN
ncbi:MAG: cysteine desulfurase, partial [Gammaproteobacteria bacterium]|nr:cysteine desulfurase [Gammaproteobacteria bacterium]